MFSYLSCLAASPEAAAGPSSRPSAAAPEDEARSDSPESRLISYELSEGARSWKRQKGGADIVTP